MQDINFMIREADKNDTEPLAKMITELGYPTTAEEMSERMAGILPSRNYKTLLAETPEGIIGMAGAMVSFFYERNGQYVRLLALVTKKEYRARGVGKALTKAIENWALNQGAVAVILNCGNRKEREAAHSFYSKLGYIAKSTGYSKEL